MGILIAVVGSGLRAEGKAIAVGSVKAHFSKSARSGAPPVLFNVKIGAGAYSKPQKGATRLIFSRQSRLIIGSEKWATRHAQFLNFQHPVTGGQINLEAALPWGF